MNLLKMPISPTIRQLQIFQTLGRCGSFSRAAAVLNMSQPALSQSVATLERLLGVQLFERTRRVVTMTHAARTFLARTDRLLADVEAAVREVQCAGDPAAGRLEIACLSSIATRILPDILRQFRARYPGAIIRVFDDDPDGIIGKVTARRVDLAFSCLFDLDDGVEFLPIFDDNLQFVCARGNPLAKQRSISWAKLNEYDVVGLAKGSSIRALIDRHLSHADRLHNVTYEVAKVSSILDIVERSDSVSVVPALALAYPEARRKFHFRPMSRPEIKREIGLILPRGAMLSASASAFRDLATDRSAYPVELHGISFKLPCHETRRRSAGGS